MNCNDRLHGLVRGLTLTSTMGILGFVIGACADHIKNKAFDTVIETGGIVGTGFGCAGFLISVGMFAVHKNTNDNGIEEAEELIIDKSIGAGVNTYGMPYGIIAK